MRRWATNAVHVVQHSTVRRNAVCAGQRSAAQHMQCWATGRSVVGGSAALCRATQGDAVLCGTMRCSAIQLGAVQRNPRKCSTMWCMQCSGEPCITLRHEIQCAPQGSGCLAAVKASFRLGRQVPSLSRPLIPSLRLSSLSLGVLHLEEFAPGRKSEILLPRSKGPPAAGLLRPPHPSARLQGWDFIFHMQHSLFPAPQSTNTVQQSIPKFLVQKPVKKLLPPPPGINIVAVFLILHLAAPAAFQGIQLSRGARK